MYTIRITAVRKTEYDDLIGLYENPIENACSVKEGDVFLSESGTKPETMCESAWESVKPFVLILANGGGYFYDGGMKNPYSALISCNDGFRPVSFLLEAIRNCNEN